MFAITRFWYIRVSNLFHIFCYYWAEEHRSLYRHTEDFVTQKFVKLRLHCTQGIVAAVICRRRFPRRHFDLPCYGRRRCLSHRNHRRRCHRHH